MIFETHAHYDDEAFNEDRKQLLSGMEENGIGTIVNVAADMAGCQATLGLCKEYPFVYGALGVHPSSVQELNEENFQKLTELCRKHAFQNGGKVLAVGEIGLDYYWKEPEPSLQKLWFERQLNLAGEAELPVIIHSRDAARDTFDMMKALDAGSIGGIVHCYSYSAEMAREFLDMGFYFGIGGVVTFPNGKKLKEVVEYLPIESMVLETDSPYLAPVPNRGKRNSSLNLPYVAEEIARLKGIEPERVIEITRQNAEKVFRMR